MLKRTFTIFKIFNYMFFARIKALINSKDKFTGEDISYKIVGQWAKYTAKTIGVKIETKGLEHIPQENCLFVSNHQSYLDIPIVLSQIDKPIGFIAKKQLKKVPLLSYWMKKIHCVFLNRDSVRDAVESINEGAKILKDTCSMVIFPEGTRSRGDKFGEFKKGSLKLATKSLVPIVPITICGSYKAYELQEQFTPCDIKLIIGEPIYINKLNSEEKKELITYIKTKIEENYEV